MRRVDAGGSGLARGEGNTDSDRNSGLIIGSVLGTFALAAFLVVAYVSYEDDTPEERPALLLNDSHIAMRFYQQDDGLTPEDTRQAIDTELRLRGYVSAGEWRDDEVMGLVSGAELDGGCGVVVGHARTGSHFRGIRQGPHELHAGPNVVAIATCGDDVEFVGTGVTSLRGYVMPGVSGAPDALTPTHRLLQAEAEHLLGRLRLVPGPRVYVETVAAAGDFTLDPPEEGCAHFAFSVAGAGAIAHIGVYGDLALFARTLCAHDSALVVSAGRLSPTTLAVRRFEPAPGVGVPTRVAAQISDAEIVTDIEDL